MYSDLIKKLREKESKYNRCLLDEAADAIEKLTAELAKKEANKRE